MTRSDRSHIRRTPTSGYDLLAEVTLILFTLSTIYGFSRLFVDGSYFAQIAAAAVTAHVLAAAVRWARGGLVISTVVSGLGLLVSAALLFPPTTVASPGGFLNREVADGFLTDLDLAWAQFQSVSAPAEVTAPFLLLIAIAMWVVAFLSDWAAFRLRSPAEALVPGSAVFIFGALFAADQNRVTTAAIAVGAALLFLLSHRLSETTRSGAWLGAGAAQKGQAALLQSGLGILALTLIGGVGAAQLLPGYDEEPVFDLSELDQPEDPRVVLSPLVDIRSRLIDQPDVEVFTVASPTRDYWRITSLDVFDGRIWRSRGSFEDASGPLDTTLPDGTEFNSVTQRFDIRALGGIWLPAAYEPAEIIAAPDGAGFEYEPESGTLIVNRDLADSDGLDYSLISALPLRDKASIEAAGGRIPSEIADRYLDLPDDFSPRVTQLAEELTANANSPYEKALALQNYFRDPNLFTYSLDVSNGHSSERIEDFLFDIKQGYCEQFAGSYAAMARSIGLPSRVAVGFTPGEYDPEIDAYRVTGKNAHAWPEVWIDNIGWLRFEPTPGRGAPRDEIYTGQAEQQASSLPGNPPTTLSAGEDGLPSAPNATTVAPGDARLESATTLEPLSDRATSGVIGGEDRGLSSTIIAAWVLGLVLLLLLSLTPLAYGIARAGRRRRAVAHDPRQRIGLAWSDARSSVEMMGVRVDAAETPSELVTRVARSDPSAVDTIEEIADEVTVVTFAPGDVEQSRADRAEELSTDLARRARAHQGALEWWWLHANPMNVWRNRLGTWGHLRPKKDD